MVVDVIVEVGTKPGGLGKMATISLSLSSLTPFFACAARSIHVLHVRTTSRLSHSSSLTLRANAYFLPTHTLWQRLLRTEASKFIGTNPFCS